MQPTNKLQAKSRTQAQIRLFLLWKHSTLFHGEALGFVLRVIDVREIIALLRSLTTEEKSWSEEPCGRGFDAWLNVHPLGLQKGNLSSRGVI